MIINALFELYRRLERQGVDIPLPGRSLQRISFRIVITDKGDFVTIEDARREEKRASNKPMGRMVPVEKNVLGIGERKTSSIYANFLWGNAAYLLGYSPKGKRRDALCFEQSRKLALDFQNEIKNRAYSAVCEFYRKWEPDNCKTLEIHDDYLSSFGVFRVQGEEIDVHETREITNWWCSGGMEEWNARQSKDANTSEEKNAICMITGQQSRVARIHNPAIKGVKDSQSGGAALVSFNKEKDAFNSYGKLQGYNAPISEDVVFAYCNALNYLLGNQRSHVEIGDSTTVFWTDSPQETQEEDELLVASVLDDGKVPAVDEALLDRVNSRLVDIARGKPIRDVIVHADDVRFYILGLAAPSKARLTVRFFWESSLGDFARNIQSHFAAMAIQRRGDKFNNPPIITPKLILRETVRDLKDLKNLPPLYGGALMRAILAGSPYPDTVALAVLQRLRVDGNVNYVRCAYLKAWLTRKSSLYQITPMLDKNNTQPGYVLGRLFAALVKTQKDALRNLNRTIKEAFYSSASSTPQCVFPHLFDLYRHHLTKLEGGLRVDREKLVQEIVSHLAKIPARLNMEQQALFALGYYHQTQDFYKPDTNE